MKARKTYFPDVNINLNVRSLKQSATLAINEKSKKMVEDGRDIIKLGLGQSPFPVPDHVVKALIQNAGEKDYLPVMGLDELRVSVAEFIQRTQGLETDREDVLVGPGTKELMFLLQLVYYGDLVIPKPSWVSYAPQAHIIGRHIRWIQTHAKNDWRLTPEELELHCNEDPSRPRILILNYPGNPSGSTYSTDELKSIAKIARKYRVVLLSDEIYGELHHEGKHISIARFYPEGTIISNGISKWGGAGGWRLGAFIFPKPLYWLKDALAVVASETFTSTSAPIQHAAIEAFRENKEMDDYLLHSRRILKVLYNYFAEGLQQADVNVAKAKGAFYIFPDFEFYRDVLAKRNIFTSRDFCTKVIEATGVAFLPGSDFGRPESEFTARIAYVDFDGDKALRLSRSYGDKELDENFIKKACPKIHEAPLKIASWLNSIS